MSKLILEATGLRKTYITGPQQVTVWQDIHLQVNAGETLAIVGASGSGKTTLLNALGGLDTVDEGQVLIDGKDLSSMNETQRTALRNQDIGFVYQFHHLLARSEEHTSELQSRPHLVCRLLLEKKKKK